MVSDHPFSAVSGTGWTAKLLALGKCPAKSGLGSFGSPVPLPLCDIGKQRNYRLIEWQLGVKVRLLVAVDLDSMSVEPVDIEKRGKRSLAGQPVQAPNGQDVKVSVSCTVEYII